MIARAPVVSTPCVLQPEGPDPQRAGRNEGPIGSSLADGRPLALPTGRPIRSPTVKTRTTRVPGFAPAAAVTVLATALVTGCGADRQEPVGLDSESGPTTSAADDATTGPATGPAADTDAESEVRAVYEEYWTAYVASRNGPDADAEAFDGIARPEAIEAVISTAQTYLTNGIRQTGEPVVSTVSVEVDGDSALVLTCVDESEWIGERNGEPLPVPPELEKPHPLVFEVDNVDGTWLIAGTADAEGRITC